MEVDNLEIKMNKIVTVIFSSKDEENLENQTKIS